MDRRTEEMLNRVREALRKPALFDNLTAQRQQIAAALDEYDLGLSTEEEEFLNRHPAGVERLYEFLAEETSTTPVECEALAAAFAVRDADDKSIGTLFKNGLCRDLGSFADPSNYFKTLEPASDQLVSSLRERIDVQAAMPAIEPLLHYGLTPLSVFLACDAPRTLARRRKYANTVILVEEEGDRRPGVLTLKHVAQEAASLADGQVVYFVPLVSWLCDIQRDDYATRRFLFRGFETISEGNDLRLQPLEGNMRLQKGDLESQWSPEESRCVTA